MGSDSFPRWHRLRKRRDFLRVYEKGRRMGGRFVVVFALCEDPGRPWRLGLTTPRRVGNAPQRNRLRRLVREFVRQRFDRTGGWDMVVNLRVSARHTTTAALWRDLDSTLRRVGLPMRNASTRGSSEEPT